MNRLLTPELRIAFRDRWRMDVPAEKVNEILGADRPIDISYHKPDASLLGIYCPIISGKCDRIDPSKRTEGCFYASPIRQDWVAIALELFRKEFTDFSFAVELPPKGDLTCKICEMVHATKFGIYELTDLNENVIFELALAIARDKHTFIVCNTEEQHAQINSLLGIEYLGYQVVESSIQEICRDKILPALNSEPWSHRFIASGVNSVQPQTVLLSMPKVSKYYEKTLTGLVRLVIQDEFGFQVIDANSHTTGNWFCNLVSDINRAQFCFVDTTQIEAAPEGLAAIHTIGTEARLRGNMAALLNWLYEVGWCSALRVSGACRPPFCVSFCLSRPKFFREATPRVRKAIEA